MKVALSLVLLFTIAFASMPPALRNVGFDKCEFCNETMSFIKDFLVTEGDVTVKFFKERCEEKTQTHTWQHLICDALATGVEEVLELIEEYMDVSTICKKTKAC